MGAPEGARVSGPDTDRMHGPQRLAIDVVWATDATLHIAGGRRVGGSATVTMAPWACSTRLVT